MRGREGGEEGRGGREGGREGGEGRREGGRRGGREGGKEGGREGREGWREKRGDRECSELMNSKTHLFVSKHLLSRDLQRQVQRASEINPANSTYIHTVQSIHVVM